MYILGLKCINVGDTPQNQKRVGVDARLLSTLDKVYFFLSLKIFLFQLFFVYYKYGKI
tara:strand:+ start:13449 stop:13622 length:174 start_codon:yes stop_codon:yes gene_type:complete